LKLFPDKRIVMKRRVIGLITGESCYPKIFMDFCELERCQNYDGVIVFPVNNH